MSEMAPGVEPGEEAMVTWEHDERGTTVVIKLGNAQVTTFQENVEDPDEATLPWLIAALPRILNQAYDIIEETEAQQEEA